MNLFLSRGLYGPRKATHVDCYQLEPGWWFLEVGSITLEVDDLPAPINRLLCTAIAVACWLLPSPLFGWARYLRIVAS